MFRMIVFLMCVVSLVGCVSSSHRIKPDTNNTETPIVLPAQVDRLPSDAPVAEESGLVFGKTDFQGLLKTAYVRLTIAKQGTDELLFYYVGSKANQSVVPWGEGKVIEPGYFYLQLPPGDYQITALAIPAGSTIAEEPIALAFSVVAGEARYLGTLVVDGIKERVRFGGVPVVKPGFEYTIILQDDFVAASVAIAQVILGSSLKVVKALLDVGTVEDGPQS